MDQFAVPDNLADRRPLHGDGAEPLGRRRASTQSTNDVSPGIGVGEVYGAAALRVATRLLVALLATFALYHIALTASTVLAFGLRYPFLDQFRLNFTRTPIACVVTPGFGCTYQS